MNFRQWAREHQTPAALILGLVVALLLEGALVWRLGEARARVEWYQSRVTEVEDIAQKVLALRGRPGSGGPKFLAAGSRFNAEAVDGVARNQKIVERVASLSAKEERHADQTIEQVVSLSVKGMDTPQLVSFLRAVEALDPAVRTRLLVITLNSEKSSLVDAKIEISAYESATSAKE